MQVVYETRLKKLESLLPEVCIYGIWSCHCHSFIQDQRRSPSTKKKKDHCVCMVTHPSTNTGKVGKI